MTENIRKYWKIWMLGIFPLAYCLLAFLPIPQGIQIGLDPSWRYALSRASEDQLIFGRDIVFTYGRLGYLITGAATNSNFFHILSFKVLVYFVLWTLVIIKIFKEPRFLGKLLIICSLLSAYLFSYIFLLDPSYQILYIIIIMLSFYDSKSIRQWSWGLGIVASICLSIKLNLGVVVLGSLFFLLLGDIYLSIKAKKPNINTILLSFLDSALITISGQFVIGKPDSIEGIKKIVICLLLSAISGIFTWWCVKIGSKDLEKTQAVKLKNIILNPKIAGWCIFYLVYSLALIFMLFYFSHPLIDYLKGSLEISSGYSEAMTVVSPLKRELIIGISEVILVLTVLILIARESSLVFSLCLAFILWMTFKHGFIRQDGHTLFLISSTPLIVAISLTKAKKISTIRKGAVVYIYLLVIMLIYGFTSTPFGHKEFAQGTNRLAALNPSQVAGNVLAFANLGKLREEVDARNQVNLSKVELPESIRKVVKNQEIDIIPWEISLVEANQLNWKPRPVFQSYNAYTTYLDNLNWNSLSRNPRDYIFYNFESIDKRHPFFDEPKSFFYVFCNYKPADNVPQLIDLPGLSKLIVLTKLNSSRCSPSTQTKNLSVRWNSDRKIEVGDGQVVRLAVKFKHSVFGKIYKTFYRNPPVMLSVTDENGGKRSYRIVPGNAQNGILIGHLPKDSNDALLFLKGQLPIAITSIKFTTLNSLVYKPDIDLSFTSYNIAEYKLKKAKDFPTNVVFVNDTTKVYGFMDSPSTINTNLRLKRRTSVVANGWAILPEGSALPTKVLLSYGNENTFFASAPVNLPSPDVAKAFKSSRYSQVRWSVRFSAKSLPMGESVIKAWVYDSQKNQVFQLIGEPKIVVEY
ncbi:hypothetical protein [Floridanema aerugineum]|uniref:Glycosyltransferase RgtA/B/C/D-like domain-containing protein n=1 Tax=Floridaenema aerugineum BLCC-F46 TaxID=3153654 RepID=A0ABV4XGR7_9CYAN